MERIVRKMSITATFLCLAGMTASMLGHAGYTSKTAHARRALKAEMRRLWTDHVVWTHEYLVSSIIGISTEYTQLATERLLKNQDDIGAAIVPYYGKKAGNALAKLLREHIILAAQVVGAAKIGDKEKLAQADKKWHENAQDIASFLSSANPFWKKDAMVAMLNSHLDLTKQQAVALLTKKWSSCVTLYDEIRMQILGMADDLSHGIIKQKQPAHRRWWKKWLGKA